MSTSLHSRMVSLVSRKGTRVTVAREATGAYDPATDTFEDSTFRYVTGLAMRIDGDPTRYETLGIKQTDAPTLVFVPDAAGTMPTPGSTLAFASVVYTVRDVDVIAPQGIALFARLIVVGGGTDLTAGADLTPVYGDATMVYE